ncbi:hypothetical protein [Shewanella woodyi]|uniref:Uncharacterized protein n=1 Tax=Shewanella woodyi (strain ATCC 51908 / MS32) TaxID=392500 RepID=B1KP85_SHEWM|nr:hypothetical protein [Shewanella woodyi]ACA84655.1 hypothetical protein Swoo_0354 [Shewanella woodyi ATCC 51908]
MSDWKCEDKEWMKQRKKEWPQYRFNISDALVEVTDLVKDEMEDLKNYFLIGDKSALKTIYKIRSGLLLELWLHPSEDIEVLKQVFNRHREEKTHYCETPAYRVNERNKFYSLAKHRHKVPFKGASRLNGREWVIDQVFMPQTLEEFIAIEGEEQRDFIIGKFCIGPCYEWGDFLTRTERFDTDICVNKIDIWKSAVKLSFEQYKDEKGIVWLIEDLDTFLASNDEKHPKQIKLAQDIIDAINDPEMPQALRDRVAEIRASKYATK